MSLWHQVTLIAFEKQNEIFEILFNEKIGPRISRNWDEKISDEKLEIQRLKTKISQRNQVVEPWLLLWFYQYSVLRLEFQQCGVIRQPFSMHLVRHCLLTLRRWFIMIINVIETKTNSERLRKYRSDSVCISRSRYFFWRNTWILTAFLRKHCSVH